MMLQAEGSPPLTMMGKLKEAEEMLTLEGDRDVKSPGLAVLVSQSLPVQPGEQTQVPSV